MIHKIISPLHVTLPRKTKKDLRVSLNMNVYRNLHHSVNGQAKKQYLEDVRSQLDGLIIQTPVEITYQLFKASKRITDKMNFISIASKFLLDAVTELGCWEDDNDEFVKTETLLPTELDRVNPRVEITITEI
jgi:Holliday junction resolvase RusA-like endonuclease